MTCFVKTFAAFNGITYNFHRLARVHADAERTVATVLSWPSETAFLDGKPGFSTELQLPPGDFLAVVKAQLLASGEFAGATAVGDANGTLEAAKARRWAYIKGRREAAENAGFTWDGSTFDSDPISQSRIQGAVLLATLAGLGGQPFTIGWTLADNSVRTLNGNEMIAAGEALGVHVATVHEVGRQLREDIDSATDITAVESVEWPS